MVLVPRDDPEPALHCPWEEELARAGITTSPALLRWGAPSVGLLPLVAAAVVALAAGGPGPVRPALALLALAAVPFVVWLAGRDEGPTPVVAATMVAPVAVLGVVEVVSRGLGDETAYRLATFPMLLVVLLWVSVDAGRSTLVALAAYLAVTGPVVAGALAGRPVLSGSAVVTWHMGFVFCAAAAYAVRLAYRANAQVREAREALARQEAADRRRQVAQDVHDVVAHTLAITMLHVTAARMAVRRSSPADAEEALAEAERHGRASLADIRRIVRLLRADDADEAGAVDAAQPGLDGIGELLESYRAAGLGVKGTLRLDGEPASATAGLAAYRVVQEALANAARHGDGTATVALSAAAGHVSLRVENPAPVARPRRPAGSGLVGMRERVASAGGTLEVGAQDGTWVVRAEIPAGASA
jgi:signal transduction histidine kinase